MTATLRNQEAGSGSPSLPEHGRRHSLRAEMIHLWPTGALARSARCQIRSALALLQCIRRLGSFLGSDQPRSAHRSGHAVGGRSVTPLQIYLSLSRQCVLRQETSDQLVALCCQRMLTAGCSYMMDSAKLAAPVARAVPASKHHRSAARAKCMEKQPLSIDTDTGT